MEKQGRQGWEHIQELRRLIQEGVESGPGIPADEVFERLKAKYRKKDPPSPSLSPQRGERDFQ